jgi:hypothetical protein
MMSPPWTPNPDFSRRERLGAPGWRAITWIDSTVGRLDAVGRIGRGGAIPADLLEALERDGRAPRIFDERPPSEKKLP